MTRDDLKRLLDQLARAEAINDRAAITMLRARIQSLKVAQLRRALEA